MAGPQVQTKYGIVEGARENDQNVFRGIPFAKPPINELRWCAPEEPESLDAHDNEVLEGPPFEIRFR